MLVVLWCRTLNAQSGDCSSVAMQGRESTAGATGVMESGVLIMVLRDEMIVDDGENATPVNPGSSVST